MLLMGFTGTLSGDNEGYTMNLSQISDDNETIHFFKSRACCHYRVVVAVLLFLTCFFNMAAMARDGADCRPNDSVKADSENSQATAGQQQADSKEDPGPLLARLTKHRRRPRRTRRITAMLPMTRRKKNGLSPRFPSIVRRLAPGWSGRWGLYSR